MNLAELQKYLGDVPFSKFEEMLGSGRYSIDKGYLEEGCMDPAFYRRWSNHDWVASITDRETGQTIDFYCDGEMRVHIGDRIFRYKDDLLLFGYENDEALSKIDEDCWVNNPWFDMYTHTDSGDFICLETVHFHILNEGIPQAVMYFHAKDTFKN